MAETELVACPSADPYNGTSLPIECVESFGSGTVGSVDTIDTLPPGTWLLYAGYFASDLTTYTGTTATTVKLQPGRTKKVGLQVAYQGS